MNGKIINIAIDGPSGAGKSTLARMIAEKLGCIYVDTGAMYRAVGLYMLRSGISPDSKDDVIPALGKVKIGLEYGKDGEQKVFLCGEDVSAFIRTQEISDAASKVSAIPAVRTFLLETQRDIAKTHSVVMDGRDIGTVILPDADVKIFLTATPEGRAKRRLNELEMRGTVTTFEEVLAEMKERDERDEKRATAPLVPAPDAVLFDNSALDKAQTLEKALEIINEKCRIGEG